LVGPGDADCANYQQNVEAEVWWDKDQCCMDGMTSHSNPDCLPLVGVVAASWALCKGRQGAGSCLLTQCTSAIRSLPAAPSSGTCLRGGCEFLPKRR